MIRIRRLISLGCCGLALSTFSCQHNATPLESTQRQVYDYSIGVEEIAMSHPLTIMSVQTGTTVPAMYRGRAHAFLIIHRMFASIEETRPNVFPRVRLVPQDTLAMALTRHQTDTIYYLARRVFMPPTLPPTRDSLQPPSFYQSHDTDPYVLVRFRAGAYSGPKYTCSGYREDNPAGYTLRDYLLKLKQKHLELSQ